MNPKSENKQAYNVILRFLKNTLSLADGLDRKGAVESIRKDVSFRGHSVWILICSIFIASLGLNTNSTAVVIGAMLISPLMGPILGVGLAIGINDFDLLKRSLKNTGVMVGVSLITSIVYFSITPISAADSEILGRTKPTILDAMIAIFGGLAGIIGNTRKEKTNVIPGVAIATALMPPLCTAGYGIAVGKWQFFLGAFYLFFLNAVLISIATFLVIRILKFGRLHQVDAKQERKVNYYMIFFVILVLVPSAWIFSEVVQESWFKARATTFISENFSKGTIINKNLEFNKKESLIELFVVGEVKNENDLKKWLPKYDLAKTKLVIHELGSANIKDIITQESQSRQKVLQELYQKSELTVKERDIQIDSLNIVIAQQKIINDPEQLQRELFTIYKDLQTFSLTNSIEVKKDGSTLVIPVATVNWNKRLRERDIAEREAQIESWIKARYQLDTLKLVRY